MPTKRYRRAFAIVVWLVALVGISYAALCLTTWVNRTEMSVESKALGEGRKVTVFWGGTTRHPKIALYALDGDKHRHGLLPAAHGALFAWVNGQSQPLFIAIHDQGRRDKDLRPEWVKPAHWRPDISGRAAAFDIFLLQELRSKIETRFGTPKNRFLFGHSLGGFYALDMPARQPEHGFAGLYAFSPTFSHDLSLLDRLKAACISTPHIYANIGLESGRETDLFKEAERKVKSTAACRDHFETSHHPGMIHAVVMLTGQLAAFQRIFADSNT